MRVLSLFDGMSCGMLAFQKCGIKIDEYVAYEIDKYAVKTSKHNFQNIKHMGDVFEADFSNYYGFDFIVGGSPCTYWSIAQSKDKRETAASGLGWDLFSQYVRALKEVKPKYFIYENNKSMSKQIRESISETFGFEPICINSALVSAQNRQRLYWVGRRNNNGTYDKVDISLPKDNKILLRDILEVTTVEKGYELAEPACMRYERTDEGKKLRKAYEAHEIKHGYHELHELAPRLDGKTNTSSTVLKDNPICIPIRIGTIKNELQNKKHDSRQYRVYSPDAKSVTLCAGGGGIGAKTGLYMVPYKSEKSKNKVIEVYECRNGIITIKNKSYPIKLCDGFYIIRKLTIEECKRLQTVPEWYEFPVSNTQAYKMLGNGWTVDVIVHIIKSILGEE